MDKYIPLKDNLNLLRDSQTNAILNTNKTEYENYIAMKKIKDDEAEKIYKIENEVISLKNDINEIKNLLRKFVNES